MTIINPVTTVFMKPRGGLYVLATVFVPVDIWVFAQNTGLDKGADVEAHAVVKIRFPADWLLVERFPANENVVGVLTFQDFFKLGFQFLGCGKAD